MKRIKKSSHPNELTQFFITNLGASWDDFRSFNGGDDYKKIRLKIFSEQGGLCAYCESTISAKPHEQRVEHFHSKSDHSNPSKNWSLDWNNIIGVCIGGESEKRSYPLPDNLSCDSHKNHLINKRKLTEDCEGSLINPLLMPAFPCLFDLNKRNGFLIPNEKNCAEIPFTENSFGSTSDLVQSTIDILNLNCDRLSQQRKALIHQFYLIKNKSIKKGDVNISSDLSEYWFRDRWLKFFTTRRILLGKYAEDELKSINYYG